MDELEKMMRHVADTVTNQSTPRTIQLIDDLNKRFDIIDARSVEVKNELTAHNLKHEKDMERILPVVETYEDSRKGGKFILVTAATIASVGGAWLIVKQIFHP